MRRISGSLALLVVLAAFTPAQAETNVDGVTGLLNTPTAAVVADGEAEFALGRYENLTVRDGLGHIARVYAATLGFLPNLEITARFVDFPGLDDPVNRATNLQDRSVALKYKLLDDENWNFAIGALDIGGESQQNEAYYGVVDYTGFSNLELSLGAGNEKLKGIFGGARWRPNEYLGLLVEYDGGNLNYGVEVHPNQHFTLKAGMVAEHPAYAGSFSFPLNPRGNLGEEEPLTIPRHGDTFASRLAEAEYIRDLLVAESFENVLVGSSNHTLAIEYESRRFYQQVDAMAMVVLIALANCSEATQELIVTPKVEDVRQVSMLATVEDLRTYLETPGQTGEGIFFTRYRSGGYPQGMEFAREGSKKPVSGDILLRVINSFVITRPDEPTFATSNGLGLEERIYLARGLRIRARQDWPFHNDLSEKTDPISRDAYLQHFAKWTDSLYTLVNAGYFGRGKYGVAADAAQYFADDRFRLGIQGGYVDNDSFGTDDTYLLGKAGFLWPELNFELTALAGEFLYGDSGGRAEATRYFGPTGITYFAYDTDRTDGVEGGFMLDIPLPWFTENRHSRWRAAGNPYFEYTYVSDDGLSGNLPLSDVTVEEFRQQLRPAYLEANLRDLRRGVALFLAAGDG